MAPPRSNGSTTSGNSLTEPTLCHVLNKNLVYPAFDRICSMLAIAELISLTRTCKQLSSLYQGTLKKHWNIDKRLERFVQDPKGLRSQMAAHNALISGSFAIQFFERVNWNEADLDIFVEQYEDAEEFQQYLCEREGYRFEREQGEDSEVYENMSTLMKVVTLVRTRNGTEAQVQIIHTKKPPVFTILENFYTTLVVNVISWNKAYAVFPQPSFLYHRTYLLTDMTEYLGTLLSKYGERGWTTQDILWPEDEASHKSMLEPRRLGDKWTWIIPFDQTGVSRSITPDPVLEFSTFNLEKREYSQPNPGFYKIEVVEFTSLVLKYHYISPEFHRKTPNFWSAFAAPRLERLSLIELYKLPPALLSTKVQRRMDLARSRANDPNPVYSEGLHTLGGCLGRDVQLPCYDDELPGWYAEWERSRSSGVETAKSD